MLYFLKSLYSFIKKEWKLLLIYFGVYSILLLVLAKGQKSNLLILENFMVNYQLNNFSPIGILNFFLEITFIIYLSIKLFNENVRFGINNLFSRISLSRWSLYSILSNLLLLIFFVFSKYIIYVIIVKETALVFEIVLYALKEYLFIVNIALLIYLLIYSRNKGIFMIFLLLLIAFICLFINHSILYYPAIFYLILIVLSLLGLHIISKISYVEHVENNFKF